MKSLTSKGDKKP